MDNAAVDPEGQGTSQAAMERTPAKNYDPLRVGVLAIHGIGHQQRYQFLSQMGEMLARALNMDIPKNMDARRLNVHGQPEMEILSFTHRGYTDKQLVLRPGQAGEADQPVEYHLFEHYWAPLMRGSTGLIDVMLWFSRAVVVPWRNLGRPFPYVTLARRWQPAGFRAGALLGPVLGTLQSLAQPNILGTVLKGALKDEFAEGLGEKRTSSGAQENTPRALLRFLLYLVLFLGILFALVLLAGGIAFALWQAGSGRPGEDVIAAFYDPRFKSVGWLLLKIALIIVGPMLLSSANAARLALFDRSVERSTMERTLLLLITFGFFAAGFTAASLLWDLGWGWVIMAIVFWRLWRPLTFLLVEYLGDVAAYTAQHETAVTYQHRRRILRYGVERLEYLSGIDVPGPSAEDIAVAPQAELSTLEFRPRFDRIVVIGHSLGSVIAYEALCEYYVRLIELDEARPRAESFAREFEERFQLFLTMGSPLDKIRYFFGLRNTNAPLYDALRVSGAYHSESSRSMRSPFATATWLNCWNFWDVISDHLLYYGDGVINYQLTGFGADPVANHERYFTDKKLAAELGKFLASM